MKRIRAIGTFATKISGTSETKTLKNKIQKYTYGTISIRDKRLSDYIGQDVVVKVSKANKKVKPK